MLSTLRHSRTVPGTLGSRTRKVFSVSSLSNSSTTNSSIKPSKRYNHGAAATASHPLTTSASPPSSSTSTNTYPVPNTAAGADDAGFVWPEILLCEDYLPSLYAALRQVLRPQVSVDEEPGNIVEITWRLAGMGSNGGGPGSDLRLSGRAVGNSPSQAKERATRKLVVKLSGLVGDFTVDKHRLIWKQVLNTGRNQLRVRTESVKEWDERAGRIGENGEAVFGSGQVVNNVEDPHVFQLIWSWNDANGQQKHHNVLPDLIAEGRGTTPEHAEFLSYQKAAELAQNVRCLVHDALRDSKRREEAESARDRLKVMEENTFTRLPDEDVRSLTEMHDQFISDINGAAGAVTGAGGVGAASRQLPYIQKVESVLPYKNGFLHTLEWTVKRGRGAQARTEAVRGIGRTRASARAKACEQMLKMFGCIPMDITEEARVVSAEIRRLCRNGELGAAFRRAQELIQLQEGDGGADAVASAQTLFLVDLWRLAASEGKAEEVLREVVARTKEGNKPLLDASVWEKLVDEASFRDVGGMVGEGGTNDNLLGIFRDIELTSRPFRSDAAKDYFRKFRFLCAAERRATLVGGLKQLAEEQEGILALQEKMDEENIEDLPADAEFQNTMSSPACSAEVHMQVVDAVLPFVSLSAAREMSDAISEIRVEDILVLEKKHLMRVVRKEEKKIYGELVGEVGEDLMEMLSGACVDGIEGEGEEEGGGIFGGEGGGENTTVRVSLLESEVTATRQVNALRTACLASDVLGASSGAGLSYDPAFISELMSVNPSTSSLENQEVEQKKPSELLSSVRRIFGPPGTGKTFNACGIVQEWRDQDILSHDIITEAIARRKQRILCVADSNVAADNFYRHLRRLGVGCLRFKNIHIPPLSSTDKNEVEEVNKGTIDRSVSLGKINLRQDEALLKKWKTLKKPRQRQNLWREALKKTSVAVTTCVGAGHQVFAGLEYPRVIVDESTQSIEPSTLIALGRNCSELVLIGDDKQLPPTVLVGGTSRSADSDEVIDAGEKELVSIGEDLRRTMFERLRGNVATEIFLDSQRRMHPELLEFPNEEFYSGRISTAAELRLRDDCEQHPLPLPKLLKNRITFMDTSKDLACHEETPLHSQSKQNPNEVDQVVDFVLNLSKSEPGIQIAVLTPYSAQQELLKKNLQLHYGEEAVSKTVRVATIDGFQGSEADVVVLSTVRSERLGFLADKRRMNVALTRAKRAVVVFGNKDVLLGGGRESWKRWVEKYGEME